MKVGIVGCGGISAQHARGYEAAGNVTIEWVYDVVPAAALALAEKTGAGVATSLEVMAGTGLDAVSICTPPGTHTRCAEPFLREGVAVLCEKPLEANVTAAHRLAALVTEHHGVFMVAFCHRFHPPIIELRRLIEAGTLGEPLLFRNIFSGYTAIAGNHRANPAMSGGGALIDHGAHSVDLFRHLVGEPTEVQAFTGNVLQEVPVEDLGMLHLSVDGRRFGSLSTSYSFAVGNSQVEWYGTRGTAWVNYWADGQPELSYRLQGSPKLVEVDCSMHPGRFVGEIAHFLDCIQGGLVPSPSVLDGVRSCEIFEAAYRSAREGVRVRVPSDSP